MGVVYSASPACSPLHPPLKHPRCSSLQLQYKGKNKTPTFKQLEGVVRNVNPVTKKAGACMRLTLVWPGLALPSRAP